METPRRSTGLLSASSQYTNKNQLGTLNTWCVRIWKKAKSGLSGEPGTDLGSSSKQIRIRVIVLYWNTSGIIVVFIYLYNINTDDMVALWLQDPWFNPEFGLLSAWN